MIHTSSTPTNNWDEFFATDDTLPCALDRLLDRALMFVMKEASACGQKAGAVVALATRKGPPGKLRNRWERAARASTEYCTL